MPITQQEIDKEVRKLKEREHFFATGINAKNYRYKSNEEFEDEAIRNLERQKKRSMFR